MPSLSNELQTAIDAAKVGAEKALTYFNNEVDLKETLKEDDSSLTIADPATEKEIKKFLHSKMPGANILGEETGGATNAENFWIVDPIDGTRAYARGINSWAVLISYFDKGEFMIGVAYFPLFDEIYYAEKGKGAYLNGERLHVSGKSHLAKSLINSGNPKNYQNPHTLSNLVKNALILRGYETTYAHALVGAGKMDASVDPYSKLWDFAPFAVIIPEAGGRITNLAGELVSTDDLGVITSNGLIHDELVRIVNK